MARRKTQILKPEEFNWMRASPEQRIFWAIACIVLLALIAFLDVALGGHVNLFILQIIPIAIATWMIGRVAGIILAVGAPLLVLPLDLSWATGTPHFIIVINELLRIGVLVFVAQGLSHIRRQGEALDRLSMTDPLTSLNNRRSFIKRGMEAVARGRRIPQPLSLVFIDLDNFKQVNDRFGHDTGDTVLQTVANAIRGGLRDTDHAARLGGDEFAIILYSAGAPGARYVTENIRDRIASALAQTEFGVTASIGVATFTATPKDFDTALALADTLMYEVKAGSKNDVAYRVFEPSETTASLTPASPPEQR